MADSSREMLSLVFESTLPVRISLSKLTPPRELTMAETDMVEIFLHPKVKTVKSMLDSYIHEVLHTIFPDSTERRIRSLTRQIMKTITKRDKLRLFKQLAEVTVEIE